MSREEAVQNIRRAGGSYVEVPGEDTDLLVVGVEGWPLSRDGRLTRSLEIARRLQQGGHPITITSEEDFLVSLGLQDLQVGMRRFYTIEQLSRILDVPMSRIRAWMRRGLVEPIRVVRRLCWFDFRQVANVRALLQLTENGVSPRRIRRSFDRLAACLPGLAVSLTQLEARVGGKAVIARLDDGRLAEPSGQLWLDFGHAREALALPKASSLQQAERRHLDADDWFDVGVEAEADGRLEDAANCYMNALLAGGPQTETCFNLGNALYGLGRHAEAMQRFLQAIEMDPDYVEAWNNLGNALAQLDRHGEAVAAYGQAIEIEPNYADAYCNLAESLEQLGRPAEAIRHWKEYLKRDPNSSWARRIRERLGDE